MNNNRDKSISVWMVQHIFFPLWAGPAERFLRYCPGFKKRGIRFSFVTAMRKKQPRHEIMEGAQVFRIGPVQEGVSHYKMFTIRALLLAIRKRPDILLLFGLAPIHIPFLLLVRLFGIKTIFVNTMSRLRGSNNRTLRTKVSDFLHLLILKSVNKLVFSTDMLSKYLEDIGFRDRKNVEIIPNGVDIKRFAPVVDIQEKKICRKELDLPSEGLIFLYVGLRIPRKGVLELMNGWKAYKQENGPGYLVLVGRDQNEKKELEDFYKQWNALVENLDQVIIHPPSKEVQKYFKASDAFVFLSKHEGMPNVILEAMGSGLPLITTKFNGFSKAFGRDKKEFLITTHEVDQIKSDLLALSNPDVSKLLSENARTWIIKHQDLEIILDKYNDLFNSVVT